MPLARGRRLLLDRPLVMAILNATPDSFSDGGTLPPRAELEAHVRSLVSQGAGILDVGGESTRPGHKPVPTQEEIHRVLPVLAAIRRADSGIPVSIDTRKPEVARAALAAGADLVNDVGGTADAAMAVVVKEAGCAWVLMRSAPVLGDVVAGAKAQLASLVTNAKAAGVREAQIVLDPGLGFGDPPGRDAAANLRLLGASRELGQGFPVLVGASRKRFLGDLAAEPEASKRVGASVAAALLAVEGGAAIVRVHDVAETAQALRVREAARGGGPANPVGPPGPPPP